ncbi:MAG TPA: aminotransferase class V-fold PLP-dependent enzyme, partial [Mycobacteriales bacterium]|nr:aminotransferase class V-fold PLP-dependent enzyme [Mycobacteriales bacterium]
VPFLLDACQSVGQLPLDVVALGADLISATGRKWLRAPRGTGFLYVGPRLLELLEPAYLDMRAAQWTAPDRYEVRPDARRFETWEANVASRIGLGVAVDYALGWGLDAIAERVGVLADGLRTRLNAVPGVAVHDRGERRCGIVTFTVSGRSATDVAAALAAAGVNVSVSTAGSARYDLPARGLTELVRASPHYYNVDAELDRLVSALPPPLRTPAG